MWEINGTFRSKSPILCKSWDDYANMLVPLLCNIPLLCDFDQRYGLILTHSSILVWRIPWIEEPGRIQSIGSQSWTRLKRLSTHPWVNFMNPSLHFVIQTVFHIKTRRGKNLQGTANSELSPPASCLFLMMADERKWEGTIEQEGREDQENENHKFGSFLNTVNPLSTIRHHYFQHPHPRSPSQLNWLHVSTSFYRNMFPPLN